MFYFLSKIFWLMFHPISIIVVLLIAALILLLLNYKAASIVIIGLTIVSIVIAAYSNIGSYILRPLEERFVAPAVMPDKVDGIIVLGGFMINNISEQRQIVELNSAADRIVEGVRLANLYPDAKFVISGEGGIYADGEQRPVIKLLEAIGFNPARAVLESKSRNTIENALMSKALVDIKPDENWLLVTSAYHMPRSIGIFRKAGINAIAVPVDYKTLPAGGFHVSGSSPDDTVSRLSAGMREWAGLVAYYMTGKTDALFPKP